jgi:hypothetical protein
VTEVAQLIRNPVQDFYNRKGLVSNEGQKKKAYFVLQEYYHSLAVQPDIVGVSPALRGRQVSRIERRKF